MLTVEKNEYTSFFFLIFFYIFFLFFPPYLLSVSIVSSQGWVQGNMYPPDAGCGLYGQSTG